MLELTKPVRRCLGRSLAVIPLLAAVPGLPLGPLVWYRFDNAARLAELAARGPGAVVIPHGSADESIPVSMSRTLAAERKDVVHLLEIPAGKHNTLPQTHAPEITAALRQIGDPAARISLD